MANTYTVEYRVTIEGTIEVEADSAQDAEDKVHNGEVDVEQTGERNNENTEVQDTYRTDGTGSCDRCNFDEDDCVCEYCDTCDKFIDDCECDEDEEDEDEDE